MTIGLSTYAFFWQHSSRVADPITLDGMLAETARLGVEVLQVCDYPAVESLDAAGLRRFAADAAAAGVRLELGTRGVSVAHLDRYLDLATALGVSLVRSMLYSADHRPGMDEAAEYLGDVLPRYARAGVSLALETYEQVPSAALVGLVERVAHPSLGICLDPANSVAALENPRDVIDRTADHVINLHVKDFGFTRSEGWVGFLLAGCPLGEGLLDLDYLYARVRPSARGITEVVEHWLPWQADAEATVALEREWTERNVTWLRRREV